MLKINADISALLGQNTLQMKAMGELVGGSFFGLWKLSARGWSPWLLWAVCHLQLAPMSTTIEAKLWLQMEMLLGLGLFCLAKVIWISGPTMWEYLIGAQMHAVGNVLQIKVLSISSTLPTPQLGDKPLWTKVNSKQGFPNLAHTFVMDHMIQYGLEFWALDTLHVIDYNGVASHACANALVSIIRGRELGPCNQTETIARPATTTTTTAAAAAAAATTAAAAAAAAAAATTTTTAAAAAATTTTAAAASTTKTLMNFVFDCFGFRQSPITTTHNTRHIAQTPALSHTFLAAEVKAIELTKFLSHSSTG